MTHTCCLNCKTKPCPVGYNCRDQKPMWFCPKSGNTGPAAKECLGDCDEFEWPEEMYQEHDGGD